MILTRELHSAADAVPRSTRTTNGSRRCHALRIAFGDATATARNQANLRNCRDAYAFTQQAAGVAEDRRTLAHRRGRQANSRSRVVSNHKDVTVADAGLDHEVESTL